MKFENWDKVGFIKIKTSAEKNAMEIAGAKIENGGEGLQIISGKEHLYNVVLELNDIKKKNSFKN